jgi:hypothetical protein
MSSLDISSLYSLNKDMLIKLICTIREDSIKEVREEYERKISESNFNLLFCDTCNVTYAITYPFKFFKNRHHGILTLCRNCFEVGNYDSSYNIEVTYEERFSSSNRKNYKYRKFFND